MKISQSYLEVLRTMVQDSTKQDFVSGRPTSCRLTNEHLKMLTFLVQNTKPMETPCEECLRQLGTFVEASLDGKTPIEAFELVREHLAMCWECREEYEALREAVENLEGEE